MIKREKKLLETYTVYSEEIPIVVEIWSIPEEFVPIYYIRMPVIESATRTILENLKREIVARTKVEITEITDPRKKIEAKKKFRKEAEKILEQRIPHVTPEQKKILVGYLVQEMLGLGVLEVFLNDPNLEEITVNCADEPIWVYHSKYGWLKTPIYMKDDREIRHYASQIARECGRQITTLTPLLDAVLYTGDRANATLYPISTKGSTITIRKFARNPWTVTHFLERNTLDKEVASFLWLCMQYEVSMLIAGGTASGKTSLMNVIACFIPPNQRVITIEETRELQLPKWLQWVPLLARPPNPEGEGEVSMLDLMVNSLRMRPDRVLVGEIRRKEEAEVLFEAMHTGHAAYATFHAERAKQVLRRLSNPPISIPDIMLESLHLIVIMYRQRKLGIRRVLEICEVLPKRGRETKVELNTLYMWDAKHDEVIGVNRRVRLKEDIELHTGLTEREVDEDLREKQKVLDYLLSHQIKSVDAVGKVICEYYRDKEYVLDVVKKNRDPAEILGEELVEKEKWVETV